MGRSRVNLKRMCTFQSIKTMHQRLSNTKLIFFSGIFGRLLELTCSLYPEIDPLNSFVNFLTVSLLGICFKYGIFIKYFDYFSLEFSCFELIKLLISFAYLQYVSILQS